MKFTLKTIAFLALTSTISAQFPGQIDVTLSDGISSLGHKEVLYADQDMMLINEVVKDMEKSDVLKNSKLRETIKPLPVKDVKCLMSVDKYCSKDMLFMKNTIIEAIKDDCAKCTVEQKNSAGKVIASMMAHDSAAWKTFLTRYDGLQKVQRIYGGPV